MEKTGYLSRRRTLVRALFDNFMAAVADRSLSPEEREQLRTDARAVLESGNISVDDLRAIAGDVREIIRTARLSLRDVIHAAADLPDVYAGSASDTSRASSTI